ncbi:hypothetical protein ACLOJK_023848 [Asimina triloba]
MIHDKFDKFIHELVLRFCTSNIIGPDMGLGLHVLDVVRKSLLLMPYYKTVFRPPSRLCSRKSGVFKIRSATQLMEAGIGFKRSRTFSLRDIEFKDGILSVPFIVVDDATEPTLLNVMAFERLHVGAGNEVTAYVFFMDNLINSYLDVAFLQSQEIIVNWLGSDNEVADLFNQLSKEATLDPDSALDHVYEQMYEYCGKRCSLLRANRHLVDLRHAYLNSPWTFISLVAAIFLLSLAVIQTVFAILQYYNPN